MRAARSLGILSIAALIPLAAENGRAADPSPGPPLSIHKATGAITVDGDLADPGWAGVERITTWFETNPGDNIEPKVKNVAYITYDDEYFYAAFDLADPEPGKIRAPLGDHDAVPSSTDYAGIIVDSRNDGKTAQMFLANPHGTQYDALSSDATGEDSSPDFFWDAAGKITSTGYTLEIRVPFSSLRYDEASDTWGILLYRNYPRDRRFQFFTAKLPRDVNCFICNSSKLTGLGGLPQGSHIVVAPYVTAAREEVPINAPGSPLASEGSDLDGGLDVKWNPTADTAINATINPDFSQIESDVAQITANERFALFFPEKRPFFLEGIDLFSTPIQAVYTRTITSPRGGIRSTGRFGDTSYTALLSHDRGGGSVILPGPTSSDFADQNFESNVAVARLKKDFGVSFGSFLATAREINGGGHNRVFGPDFQWRPKPSDSVTGQFLWSDTRTPTDSSAGAPEEWDGRTLRDHAALLYWSHGTEHEDWFTQLLDIGADFRADNGFVPQVGYREGYLDGGYTWRPQDHFLSRLRLFTTDFLDRGEDGETISSRVSVGAGMDGRLNSFFRIELNDDHVRAGTELLERMRPVFVAQMNPARVINQLTLQGFVGQEIDFANAREGDGGDLSFSGTIRPSDHLELRLTANRRWLDIDEDGLSGRLFTAQVERLRMVWSFSSRAFIRLIGQYVETTRDPDLYLPPTNPGDPDRVDAKTAQLTAQALFAYKVNWQTLVYLGYGDDAEYSPDTNDLEKANRQLFLKLSYAWQH